MMSLLTDALRKRKLGLYIAAGVAALLVTLMLVGSFFDLEIAKVVAAKPRGVFYYTFGLTFEVLGFLPAILVDVALFAAISVYAKTKGIKILFHVLCGSAIAGAVYCGVFWTMSNHGFGARSYISIPVMMVLGAGLSFPTVQLFKRFQAENLKKLIYVLVIGAIMGALSNLIVSVCQAFWGRVRYFEIVEQGIEYGHWYLPLGRNPIEGVNATSFPSLHASSVASIIVLPMAAWVLNAKKSITVACWAIAGIMLVCVPLSRMVIGWHFLTDVTFSLVIGFFALTAAVVIIDFRFGKRMKAFIGTETAPASNAAGI